MGLFKSLRERRERYLDERVDRKAEEAAKKLVKLSLDGPAPAYNIEIGRKPPGIDSLQYLGRVGTKVIDSFNGTILADKFIFDPEAAEEASSHLNVYSQAESGHGTWQINEHDLVAVFKPKASLN